MLKLERRGSLAVLVESPEPAPSSQPSAAPVPPEAPPPGLTPRELVNRAHPTRASREGTPYGYVYQNGVRPGARKLAQFQEVLRLQRTPPLRSQDGQGGEAICYAKLFDPAGSWTWYLTEWDGQEEAFGFVHGHEGEWGYVPLQELSEVKGRFGIGIEIDMHWIPAAMKEIADYENR